MIQKFKDSKLQSIIDNVNAAIILTDIKGQIVYVNRRCEEMTGYKQEEMIGRLYDEFSLPEDISASFERLEKINKGELTRYRIEKQWIKKDGTLLWTGVSVAPLFDEKGNIEYLTATIVDISEQKKREAALKKLLEEQYIDIGLSKKILAMINSQIPRYIDLPGDMFLFCDVVALSCHQEGGDHFFIREQSNNKYFKKAKTLISIKDQSGHQVGCVLRSIITDLIHQAIIHSKNFLSLEEIIADLNKSLMTSGLLKKDDFVTALNFEIDHKSLMMRYVSCGHPRFLIIRKDKIFSLPSTKNRKGSNPPLAALENYQFSANEFQLKKGDKLILYTDGLLEAAIPEEKFQKGNESISLEELKKIIYNLISENIKIPVQTLLDELLSHVSAISSKEICRSGKNNSKDDITLIGLEIEDKKDIIEEKWCPENIEALQKQINSFMEKRLNEWKVKGYSKPHRLQICFEEAIVNAWVHGHKSDPTKPIYVKYRYQNDFHLEIIDTGKGFDLNKVPDPREPAQRFRESGRGIFMIHSYASRARWNSRGNHLTMTFKKEPNTPEKRSIQMAEQCLNLWKN